MKSLQANKIEYTMNVGIAGLFKIEAIRPDGSRRLLADWFPNLILNAGLNRMHVGGWITGCAVGTNNATPTVTQTALGNLLAWSTTQQSAIGSSQFTSVPYYGYYRVTYRFGVGVAQGNISEVGVGWGSTSMFSRALVLDGNGDPTTITVLSDEILDVTYEIRQYVPESDVTGQINLNGVTHNYTVRAGRSIPGTAGSWIPNPAYNIDWSDGWAGPYAYSFCGVRIYHDQGLFEVNQNPGTTNQIALDYGRCYRNNMVYTVDSFYRDGTSFFYYDTANHANGISLLLISAGSNSGGYGYYSPGGVYQFYFDPPIAKDNTLNLSLVHRLSITRRT